MYWANNPPRLLIVCFTFILALIFPAAARLAVMSVDLGGEFMKIAVVKPGVPMEIVLNAESARKTRSIVAFRDGERHFANNAYNTGVRFPAKAFWFLTHIIGRNYEDPSVQQFGDRFPYYRDMMVKDQDRGTVLFQQDNGVLYSCEELLGMLLEKAREYAQQFAGEKIQDAVIAVPTYYSQAERRAVLTAAQLVGINVLQLMSSSAAVALDFGVSRRKQFNTSTQYYMFYDMGASSTVVSIIGYTMVKSQEGTFLVSNPQLTIKGIGYDRSLGGLEMTLRLRDHLARIFNSKKKRTAKVEDSPRAMAKLLKEAERVKKVLSVNSDHVAQVEGLLDGEDFSARVTRAEYEHLIEDLLDQVTSPVQDALKASEITWPEIREIILMGGASRMPKVQDLLVKYSGKTELGKSINTDEAAALGAVYQAAYLAKGFKVKTFHVREANVFPINVEFEKHRGEEETDSSTKTVKRMLFGRMHYFPQKKVLTFNKQYVKDFNFSVSYGDLDFLSEEEQNSIKLQGVGKAFRKHSKVALYKGVKAHFRMDDSGLLHLDMVESVFEKGDPNAKGDEQKGGESTWSKIGNAFGSLLGGKAADKPSDTKGKNSATAKSEKIKANVKVEDMAAFSRDKMKQAKKRLAELQKQDEEKVAQEKAKSELEGFIFDAQDKLGQDAFQACSTEEERSSIRHQLSEASDWLYEQPGNAKKTVFTKKQRELAAVMKKLERRVKEKKERPQALKALKAQVSAVSDFLNNAQSNSAYTASQLSSLEKLLNETTVWQMEAVRKQDKQGDQGDPSLLVETIQLKVKALDRELKQLQRKSQQTKKTGSQQKSKTKGQESKTSAKNGETSSAKPKANKTASSPASNSHDKERTKKVGDDRSKNTKEDKEKRMEKEREDNDDDEVTIEDVPDDNHVPDTDSEDSSPKSKHKDFHRTEL